MQDYKIYLNNAFWVLVEKVVTLGISYFVVISIARYSGVDEFGEINLAFSLVALISSVTRFGFDQYLVAASAKEEFDLIALARFAYRIMLSLSIVAVVLVFAYAIIVGVERWYLPILSLTLLAQPFIAFELILQGSLRSKAVARIKTLSLLATNSLKLLLVLNGFPIEYVLVIFILDYLIVGFFSRRLLNSNEVQVDAKALPNQKEIFRNIVPLVLSAVVVSLSLRLDQYVVYYFFGALQAGYYSAPQRLIESVAMLFGMMIGSLVPLLASHYGKLTYSSVRKKIQICVGLGGLCLGIFIFIFSDEIILLVYGKEYSSSIKFLGIMAFYVFMMILVSLQNRILIVENKAYFILTRTMCQFFVTIMMYFPMIKFYGVYGVTVSSTISLLIMYIIFEWKISK